MMGRRVLICDDSPLLRRVIGEMLTEGGMHVVGEARDGVELVERVAALRPDVVTLDVEMPRRDGLEGLRALMATHPVPVVMVSSLTGAGTAATIAALEAGAVDAVCKPALRLTPAGWGPARDELVRAVRAAAGAKVSALAGTPRPARPGAALAGRAGGDGGPLVVIASSTGGPRALAALLPRLPSPLGAGVVIVQHMPPGFTGSLARRLDELSKLTVREARPRDTIAPGTALIARAGAHLEITGRGRVAHSDAPPVGSLRPRADITLEGAARHYGRRVLAVVVTGMGQDGLVGCRAVRAAGGRVIAEDASTAVVWGMPGAVAQAGLADAVLPLDAIALGITEMVATMGGM